MILKNFAFQAFLLHSSDEWRQKEARYFGRAHYDDIFGKPTRAHGCIGIIRQLCPLLRRLRPQTTSMYPSAGCTVCSGADNQVGYRRQSGS